MGCFMLKWPRSTPLYQPTMVTLATPPRASQSPQLRRHPPPRNLPALRGFRWIYGYGYPNYLYSYPFRLGMWISIFVSNFNIVLKWIHSNWFSRLFSIRYHIRIRRYPARSVSVKKKVPFKTNN